ncbi:MAG: DUF4143 domain-containing protein [Acidimicrobiia bacterium]|nr:DUF4143 domain-containing protein [Acidimicrobiia bacterium]MCY4457722.1 AAA family ATPase [Acidimicrobiaceae bacterium]
MHEYRRPQSNTLIQRLSEPPRWLIAVFGPRQTGKTTLVSQALGSLQRPSRLEAIDNPSGGPRGAVPLPIEHESTVSSVLEGVRDRRWLIQVWEESRHQAWESENGFVLALDEIQKIRGWSEAVKGLWDADRAARCPMHVIILGSAPLLMQDGLSESLAGRFEPLRVTHWSWPEMRDGFGFELDQFVFFGGYPSAAHLTQDSKDWERWKNHVWGALIEPNIERDILHMTRVDKPSLLKRLLELGSYYSGQELAFNKMLGQLQDAGNTVTLDRYLKLLTGAGLLAGLSKHSGNAVRIKGSTPKLNVLNTALMAFESGYTFAEARADRSQWGRMVESAVGAHLLNTASTNTHVRYWREAGSEVDFVLHRGPRTVGIEVKSGMATARLSGLDAFKRRFNPQATVVVGRDIELSNFLSHPADYWLEQA